MAGTADQRDRGYAGLPHAEVCERLDRFNVEALAGLDGQPGVGRKPRIIEVERGQVITLARSTPLGKPVRDATGNLAAADESAPAG